MHMPPGPEGGMPDNSDGRDELSSADFFSAGFADQLEPHRAIVEVLTLAVDAWEKVQKGESRNGPMNSAPGRAVGDLLNTEPHGRHRPDMEGRRDAEYFRESIERCFASGSPELRSKLAEDFDKITALSLEAIARQLADPEPQALLRAALEIHPSVAEQVLPKFAAEIDPERRSNLVRGVGRADPNLRRAIIESVFSEELKTWPFLASGIQLEDGLVARALRLHDAIKLVQEIEAVYDPNRQSFEEAISGPRERVAEEMKLLIGKDRGETAVRVADKLMHDPPTVEEARSILGPLFDALGRNALKQEALELLVSMPKLQKWFEAGGHSELFRSPQFARHDLAMDVLRLAANGLAKSGEEDRSYQSSIRMLRYVARWSGHDMGSFFRGVELDRILNPPTFPNLSQENRQILYAETVRAMFSRNPQSSIAIGSLVRQMDLYDDAGVKEPLWEKRMKGLLLEAAVRSSDVVLIESAISKDPSRAVERLVGVLRDASRAGDMRAAKVITGWELTAGYVGVESITKPLILLARFEVPLRKALERSLKQPTDNQPNQ
jgi:hypothetical protein